MIATAQGAPRWGLRAIIMRLLPAAAAVAGGILFLLLNKPAVTAVSWAAAAALVVAACIGGRRNRRLADAAPDEARTASERLAKIGSIAASVAHEIRNPLSALDIHAQLLEENLPPGPEGDAARSHLDIIRSETHRLNVIVENFIRFARHKPLDARPTQMPRQLQNVLRLVESEAAERGIVIQHHQLRTDLPEVMADADLLEQAFLNIVINALQSMPTGGTLGIASRVNGGCVECVVSNTGPPIEPEQLDSIFDLYFTTKDDGTGLGLPIARKILSEHNGYITVHSDAGETSFVLGVPTTKHR